MKQFEEEVSLYPVTCEPLSAGRSDRQWLDAVLAGGAKIVQLRDKVNRDNVVLEKAKYFRQRTREAGALFIINDRVDIGLLAEADGIHVGQGDLPPAELRRLAADMIIGLSCNTVEDVKALARGGDSDTNPVSYYNIGPIYATATKEGLQHFLGTGAVADFSRYSSLPFTVMGGIKQHHVADLVAAGAKRIAVVTAISRAVDIEQETARWIQLIDESANDGKNKRQ
jgi:thiamine-phosphate pyrophosphorylase